MTRKSVSVLVAILILGTLAIFAPTRTRAAATAPTFTVNSPADIVASAPLDNGVCETAPGNGVCTLRAAIMKANHYPGGNATINFGLPGTVTYTLGIAPSGMDDELTGDLNITRTMTISGNGAENTIMDGNAIDRVLAIGNGVTVTISGVTIQNGKISGLNAIAGGIRNDGTLTLAHSVVSRNSTNSTSGGSYGGGIYNSFPLSLTIINSTINGNSANTASGIASGGGIIGGGLFINSTVSGNTTSGDGGGISGGGTLINSTVSGNAGLNGGGIYGSTWTLMNSTVSGNHANDNGGGIYHIGGTMSLFNVTIAGNQANADASGVGVGGGVANGSASFNFQNSLIAGNTTVTLVNGFPILTPEDCSGTITSGGNNIMYDTSDCTVNGSVTLTDPNLGPLQNNGGSTFTHALLPGSPAIDAGNSGGCTDNLGALLTSDQRGDPRPVFGKTSFRCDIGAFELQQLLYLPLILR